MTDRPVYIYKCTNQVNGHAYVGITYDFEYRKKRHHIDSNSAVYPAIQKHGVGNFNWEILEIVNSRYDANLKETEYIEFYDTFHSGYNRTNGGEGLSGIHGEDSPASKFNEKTIIDIINDPCSHTEASRKYGVNVSTIHGIRIGKSWMHLDRSNAPEEYVNDKKKLTSEIVQSIINDDCSQQDASIKYEISIGAVAAIRDNRTWKNLDRSNAPIYKNDVAHLTDEIAQQIINDPCCAAEAAKKYNTHTGIVHELRRGYTWVHLDRSNAPEYEVQWSATPSNILIQIINDPCSHNAAVEKYNVKRCVVEAVRAGKSWTDLDRSKAPTYHRDNTKLTDEIAQAIIDEKSNHTQAGKNFNVSRGCITAIRSGKTWKHLDRSNAPNYKIYNTIRNSKKH